MKACILTKKWFYEIYQSTIFWIIVTLLTLFCVKGVNRCWSKSFVVMVSLLCFYRCRCMLIRFRHDTWEDDQCHVWGCQVLTSLVLNDSTMLFVLWVWRCWQSLTACVNILTLEKRLFFLVFPWTTWGTLWNSALCGEKLFPHEEEVSLVPLHVTESEEVYTNKIPFLVPKHQHWYRLVYVIKFTDTQSKEIVLALLC